MSARGRGRAAADTAATAGADEAPAAPPPAQAARTPAIGAGRLSRFEPSAPAKSFWSDLHPAAGVGITFRSKQITGKLVPASITWKDDHYEFFVAYFRDQEIPDLTFQGSRRTSAWRRPCGPPRSAGASTSSTARSSRPSPASASPTSTRTHATTAAQANDMTPALDAYERVYHGCNKLDGSRLNYALQLGVRVYMADHSQGLELVYRHISDAGMTNGNRGEDFVTALLVF